MHRQYTLYCQNLRSKSILRVFIRIFQSVLTAQLSLIPRKEDWSYFAIYVPKNCFSGCIYLEVNRKVAVFERVQGMLPIILFWFRKSLQILIKAPMLNYLAQFFFADLSEKTTSRILRDNYFAPEQKLKLTRSASKRVTERWRLEGFEWSAKIGIPRYVANGISAKRLQNVKNKSHKFNWKNREDKRTKNDDTNECSNSYKRKKSTFSTTGAHTQAWNSRTFVKTSSN